MAGDPKFSSQSSEDRPFGDERQEEHLKEGERRGAGRRGFRDIARRIIADRERGDRGERDVQLRDAIMSLLETGDRARTEFVRLIAREIRTYLTELRIGEGIHNLLTNYSLEIHASLHLKPLTDGNRSRNTTPAQSGRDEAEREDEGEHETEAGKRG